MRGYKLTPQTAKTIMATESAFMPGNSIPPVWFYHLKFGVNDPDRKTGKPYLLAAFILSDIVYWHRPIFDRDEETGKALPPRKKFKAEKLQKSYQAYVDLLGVSKREVSNACHFLQNLGLIKLNFETVKLQTSVLNNMLFIDLYPEAVQAISRHETIPFDGTDNYLQLKPLSLSKVIGSPLSKLQPITLKGDTNTEITTKNTKEKEPFPQKPFLVGDRVTVEVDGSKTKSVVKSVSGGDVKLDPLTHILELSGSGIAPKPKGNPTPDDAWLSYGNEAVEIYSRLCGSLGNTAQERSTRKNIISGFASEQENFNPKLWEQSITESMGAGVGPRNITRFTEVYACGSYKAYLEKTYPKQDKSNKTPEMMEGGKLPKEIW